MHIDHLVIAAALIVAGPVFGATGLVAKPGTPLGSQPDCWVEHTQVQPSPAGNGRREYIGDARSRLLAEEHVGSEHASAAARKRPCNAEPPRATPRLSEMPGGPSIR